MFEQDVHDIIIVGGGPAGMTAALYAARAGKRVCLVEKEAFGGQITHSPRVENYPGTLEMTGNDFAARMTEQVMALDVDVEMGAVVSVRDTGACKEVLTGDGTLFKGRCVILANGARHRLLGVEGEEGLVGGGVFFCAVCDGALFAGKTVAVVGGGNSALQEAALLAESCAQVVLVQNLPTLTGEQMLQRRVLAKPNVRAVYGTVVDGFLVEGGRFCGLSVRESTSGAVSQLPCDGVFVAIGLAPENQPFAAVAALDAGGYFAAGEDCATKTPGVFAAGDCRAKQVRQLSTATADGAVAALAACRHLDGL